MSGYIIVEVNVTDQEAYDRYRDMVAATLEPYGGRFLVRGGNAEILEGNWLPARFVVIAFESVDQAKAWWDAPEYAEAKALRQSAAETQMIVVEGA